MITDQRKKEIFNEVDKRLLAGESSKAIFDAYSTEFSDREPLARKILEYVDPKVTKKYKWPNIVLAIGVGYFAIWKLIESIGLLRSIHPKAIIFSIFIPILDYFFIWEILKRKRWVYSFVGMFTLLALMRLGTNDYSYVKETWQAIILLIDIFVMVTVIVLSFYLQSKLFAKQSLLGPKKDSKGNYIFPN